jgi:hypothetical protein
LKHREARTVLGDAAISDGVDLWQSRHPVTGVLLQLQRVGAPGDQLIRPGAGGMAGEFLAPLFDELGVDDLCAGMGEVVGEGAKRIFQRHLHRIVVNHVGVVDHHVDALPLEVVGGIAAAIKAEFHRRGVEWRAIGKFHALAQVKNKLGCFLVGLEAFGQRRNQLHVTIELEKTLVSQPGRRLRNIVVQVLRVEPVEIFGNRHHEIGRARCGGGEQGAHEKRGGDQKAGRQSGHRGQSFFGLPAGQRCRNRGPRATAIRRGDWAIG